MAVTYTSAKTAKSSVSVPDSVTLAGGVKATVTAVAANALKGSKKLTKLTVGKNVKTIGKSACQNAKKLKSVTLGAGVTSIGSKAFSGCKALKSLTIKSTKVKSFGKKAFAGVSGKITVKVPKKKLALYKKLLKKAGLSSKAKIKGI